MSSTILVVSPAAGLTPMLQLLTCSGYEVTGAATFEDATRLLATMTPDLLIADERLGAFNGLHLVLRGRGERPDMRAIVTTSVKDACFEREALRLNAQCFVKPLDPADWLLPISRAFESANVPLTSASRIPSAITVPAFATGTQAAAA
jgi:DNA-binding NtrC family response regulator